MAGSNAIPSGEIPKNVVFNLSQVAGTYNLATATGDVWIEIVGAYVKTAATGLTSAVVVTDHATPKTLIASILLVALTIDSIPTIAIGNFMLPSGKHIQGTIVGTGTGGELDIYVRWSPMTSGASLA